MKRLMFLHHLETLPKDSLAYEVFQVQKSLNLPGLLSECSEVLCRLNVTSMESYSKEQWRRLVKEEMYQMNKEDLIRDSICLKKIGYTREDKFRRQSYLSEMNVLDARLMFKIRTNMVPTVQMNFMSDAGFEENLWTCSGCSHLSSSVSVIHGNRDTQQHIVTCPGYTSLRDGRNLNCESDLVNYFRDVLKVRSSGAN